jgi:hypothetical protein
MPPRWQRFRFVAAILLLVSFASVQTVLALDLHHHDGSDPDSHSCLVCHAVHLPALQSNHVELAAPVGQEWRVSNALWISPKSHADVFHSSRAPPA